VSSPDLEQRAATAARAPAARYDVLVIGAGLSGMCQLHPLRQVRLAGRVFEAGAGVGGTGSWNRVR
jgi:acetone monooxygenase